MAWPSYSFDFGPAGQAEAVSPNDSTELTYRALYVGGAGDLVIIPAAQDTSVTLTGVAAGSWVPIAVKKVMAATTASSIVGLR